MILLRVSLPDRPGSLGSVATALGAAGADIEAIEIVERGPGYAIDDVVVDLPSGQLPDRLVTACQELPGVDVRYVGQFPSGWGLQGDADIVDRMAAEPDASETILTAAAPQAFRSRWAMLLDPDGGRVLHQTPLAPDLHGPALDVLGSFDSPTHRALPDGWLPGWSETLVAGAPFPTGHVIVVGRTGLDFIASEVARLRLLAALAHHV